MTNIDLTTLPGWSSISDGSHSITIVAKADGYRDSEPSAAVSVTKGVEDQLAGTWVFNEHGTGNAGNYIELSKTYMSFISNDISYSAIECSIAFGTDTEIYYDDTLVCAAGSTWTDEAYKTINITSKLSEVTDGDTLLAWLQANATKQ